MAHIDDDFNMGIEEEEDFELSPFSQFGGLGKVSELFGDKLKAILDDLNRRLPA